MSGTSDTFTEKMIEETVIISSGVSLGIAALAEYVSSPSSTGSWMFYDIPELLISTGAFTQTQPGNELSSSHAMSQRLLWLKKPR